jgi:hypothetical protein
MMAGHLPIDAQPFARPFHLNVFIVISIPF